MELHNQAVSLYGILEPVDDRLVNLKDSKGKTPLMQLFDVSRFDQRNNDQFKVNIDSLISAGADVNAQDHGFNFFCFTYL